MRWRAPIIAAVLLATFAFFFMNTLRERAGVQPEPVERRPAPRFRLEAVQGSPLSLTELRGRPVVLNFWATWCEACREEHGLLQHAATVYDGQAYFVGVVVGTAPEAARHFLQLHGRTYPQLLDPESHIADAYGVKGLPETFVIDAQGELRDRLEGPVTFADLSRVVEPLLVPAAAPQ